jgi:hypothetical protein
MSGEHALLSASSSRRWLSCTPSARLEETMPESESTYADEGTAAHALAELELSWRLGKIEKKTIYSRRLGKLKRGEYYSADMARYIDGYATEVLELVAGYDAAGSVPHIDLEQRVDYGDIVPGGFGTADVVIVAGDTIQVIDLKYGKGVAVDAHENPQLMLYALGAAKKYDILYNFSRVIVTVMQPRLDSSSSYELALDDLYDWATDYVAPRAALAFKGTGEYAPSEDACRFCRVKSVCRARADANLATARDDFALPPVLSVEDVAELLPRLDELAKWVKDIQTWALEQARDHDVVFQGFKLVEGRSVRSITDAYAAELTLKEAGYAMREYIKPTELKGITDLEKMLGKPRFAELLGGLVVKPAGKPVLVPESDKRPALGGAASAAEDFKD